MRKLILVLLSLTISFAVMSCGGGSRETVIKHGNTNENMVYVEEVHL